SARTPAPELPGDDDPDTLALLCRGDTLGVNQLESPAVRHLLIQLRPRSLGDVIQAIALVRPAAAIRGAKERFVRRRRGLDPVPAVHPELTSLRETEGLVIYEDDVLQVIRVLTGLPAVDADRLRKRIARHTTEEEGRQLAAEFRDLASRHGEAAEVIEAYWEQ